MRHLCRGLNWYVEVLLKEVTRAAYQFTQRIVVQDGWFKLHRYLEEKNKLIALENQKRFKDNLAKFTVPAPAFPYLRTQLEQLGLSDHVLFPDLPTLCNQLQSRVFPPGKTK